jgi:hypothetical protein
MIIVAFLLGLAIQQPDSKCWHQVGLRAEYGSFEQGQELRRLAKSTQCKFVAITWRIKLLPDRRSIMVWDVDRATLFRIHVDKATGSVWDHWAGVTKAAIAKEDLSDGFDFQGYRTGSGKAPVTGEVREFIKKHSPSGFVQAL